MIYSVCLGDNAMNLKLPLVALALFGATASASAQVDPSEKYDLKPLIPPVFNLQTDSQMKSGTVGGTQTPYTTAPLAPLQESTKSQSQPAPGLRLTFPSR
jgi:hypothetical protein